MIDPQRLKAIAFTGTASTEEVQTMATALLNVATRTGAALLHVATRTGDPGTSRDAAASVRMTANRSAVLHLMLRMRGPWTDEDLIKAYCAQEGMPRQSESGIRSRRAELARLGHCMVWDTVRNDRKRVVRRWQTVMPNA